MTESNTLSIVFEARNLTGPAFKQLQGDLQTAQQHLEAGGQKGLASGEAINKGMQTAAGGVKSFADGAAQGLGVSLPLGIAAATAAIVGFGVSSVKSFVEFDKQMRGVSTLLGTVARTSETSFEGMSAQVRAFALRMGVDATGAAKALYETISAGVPAGKQAFDVLEIAARGAIGGMTDTKTAVDGLTTVLGAYKLGAQEAERVSDIMFQTVNLGKVQYGELAQYLGRVVPLAAAAGVSFDQVGAAIATQTKQGIQAAAANTNLAQVIQAYIKPTEEATQVAKILGIQFDANTLKTKGLQGALNEAAAAAAGDDEALIRLFGSVEAGNAVLALTGKNAQGAAEDLRGVGQSAGASQDAFDEMEKSAARSFERAKVKADELKVELGEKLAPVLEKTVEFVGKVGEHLGLWPKDVPSRAQTQEMRELGDAAEDTATNIQLVVAAFLAMKKAHDFFAGDDNVFKKLGRDIADVTTVPIVEFFKKAAAGATEAEQVTKAYADAEANLNARLERGLVTGEQYAEQLKALKAAHTAAAQAALFSASGVLDAGEASQAGADAALALVEATVKEGAAIAQAARDTAAANAAREAGLKATSLSIKERIEAQKEADREAKQAADKAIADAKRLAEAIVDANDTAKRSYEKFGSDVADTITDGNARLLEINRKHGHDWNQAIIDATAQQQEIYRDAGVERDKIVGDADTRILEAQGRMAEVQEGRNREAVDYRLDLERRAADEILRIRERDEDRKVEQDKRDGDRAKAAAEERLAIQEAERKFGRDGSGGDEGGDADRARDRAARDAKERDDEARDEATRRRKRARDDEDDRYRESQDEERQRRERDAAEETEQHKRELAEETVQHTRTLAEQQKNASRDAADEEVRHAREVRDMQKDLQRGLRDAQGRPQDETRVKERFEDEQQRENERHADKLKKEKEELDDALAKEAQRAADALAKEEQRHNDALAKDLLRAEAAKATNEERHTDVLAKAQLEYDDAITKADERKKDDKEARDEAHGDAMDRIKKQFDEAKKRAEEQKKERLAAIQVAEDAQKKADTLADQRKKDADAEAAKRADDDFQAKQKNAAQGFQDDIDKIGRKRDEDIKAVGLRESAAIEASNNTLTKHQESIDEARNNDYGKFVEDIGKRFRELEQQFGRSMQSLDKLIPVRVGQVMGGAALQIGNATGLLNAGASPPAGTNQPQGGTLREGGKPGETQAEVDAFNANAAKADADNRARAAGRGAGEDEGEPLQIAMPSGGAPAPSSDIDFGTPVDRVTDRALASVLGDYAKRLEEINTEFGRALLGGDSATAAGKPAPSVKTPPASAGGESALTWAASQLGSQAFNGMCERFVEMAHGTSGVYPSAKAAAGALQTAGGRMEDAPRGALVFFRADPSNGGWGHVGIAEGGGRFISATSGGVSSEGPTRYWSSLYSGHGAPRFAEGGRIPGARGAAVPVIAHGGELVLNTREQRVVRDLVGRDDHATAAQNTSGGNGNAEALLRAIAALTEAMQARLTPDDGTRTIVMELDGHRVGRAILPHVQAGIDGRVSLSVD